MEQPLILKIHSFTPVDVPLYVSMFLIGIKDRFK